MEGPKEEEERAKRELLDDYIKRKVEWFWGYPDAFAQGEIGQNNLRTMIIQRFTIQRWVWQDRIEGLQEDSLAIYLDTLDIGSTEWMTVLNALEESVLDDLIRPMMSGEGTAHVDKHPGGLYSFPIYEEPEGIHNRDTMDFGELGDIIYFYTEGILLNLRDSQVERMISSMKDDSSSHEDEEGEGYPEGVDFSTVEERARAYIPELKARIEKAVRDYQDEWILHFFLLPKELYYEVSSGRMSFKPMDWLKRIGYIPQVPLDLLKEKLARANVVEQMVRDRDIRRAEQMMMRYTLLRLQRGEDVPYLVPDTISRIAGFVRNVWPNGFAELELANSFEDYLRKGISEEEFLLGEETAIYPEEQKTRLSALSTLLESIVRVIVNTEPVRRKTVYETRKGEFDNIDKKLRSIQSDHTTLDVNTFFDGFHRFLKESARQANKTLSSFTDMYEASAKVRERKMAPAEFRTLRIVFVLETFGRRDAFRFLEKMLKENSYAVKAYIAELEEQKQATYDAVYKGVPKRTSPKKERSPSPRDVKRSKFSRARFSLEPTVLAGKTRLVGITKKERATPRPLLF